MLPEAPRDSEKVHNVVPQLSGMLSQSKVFTLGGLPPLVSHPDYVYEKLFSMFLYERYRA